MLDVGAHIGTFAIPLAKTGKKVVAFEAQPEICDILRRNIADNHVDVKVYNNAVGHLDNYLVSMEDFARDGLNAYQGIETGKQINIGGIQLGDGNRKVVMYTLDTLIKDKVGFIKMDIEGSEPLAFYGAMQLIRRDRPVILFERNYKVVTSSMEDIMPISSEVKDFNIVDFVTDYYPPINLESDNILLIPRGDKQFTECITPNSRITVDLELSGNIAILNGNLFGHYHDNIIEWENNSVWFTSPPDKYPYSVTIAGACKNVSRYAPRVLKNIERLADLFAQVKVVIVESCSCDNTLDLLREWKFPAEIIHLEQTHPSRTVRLAECRNLILDKAVGDYLIMIDFDNVNKDPWDLDGFRTCFYHRDWTAMFANSTDRYYDIWALRTDYCPGDLLADADTSENKNKFLTDAFAKYQVYRYPSGKLEEVTSAFGGIGIYRTQTSKSAVIMKVCATIERYVNTFLSMNAYTDMGVSFISTHVY